MPRSPKKTGNNYNAQQNRSPRASGLQGRPEKRAPFKSTAGKSQSGMGRGNVGTRGYGSRYIGG